MSLDELKDECKERKIKIPKKAKAKDLVALLEEDDGEEAGDSEDEKEDPEEDADGIAEKLIEFASVRGIEVKDDMTREEVIEVLKEYEYEAEEMEADEIALFKEAGIADLIEGLEKPKKIAKKKK
jgi:hypothetical protein